MIDCAIFPIVVVCKLSRSLFPFLAIAVMFLGKCYLLSNASMFFFRLLLSLSNVSMFFSVCYSLLATFVYLFFITLIPNALRPQVNHFVHLSRALPCYELHEDKESPSRMLLHKHLVTRLLIVLMNNFIFLFFYRNKRANEGNLYLKHQGNSIFQSRVQYKLL